MFAGKKSAQIREILISESAWEEMTCLFAPSLDKNSIRGIYNHAQYIEGRREMMQWYADFLEGLK